MNVFFSVVMVEVHLETMDSMLGHSSSFADSRMRPQKSQKSQTELT